MISLDERRAIVADVSRRAFEASSAESLGLAVMGPIERLVDAASSVFYRINEHGNLVPLAGTLVESGYRYSREYYALDPLQSAMRDENPWVFKTERSPVAWRHYLDGPVYLDLCKQYDIHSYLHIRLSNSEHGLTGMYGIMLSHGERQPSFTPQDELDLIELLPALEAAVRRSAREGERQGSTLALEAALESTARPTVILDPRGGLVWASRRARTLLAWDRPGRPAVPKALREGALHLGALVAGDRTSASPRVSVNLVGLDGEKVGVDLRLARMHTGAPVIVAELDVVDAPAMELAARYSLTAAQASILASLAEGLSDRAIAERHGISLPTVRSHLGQILAKLGVESRLQAGLLAARQGRGGGPNAR